VLLHFLVATGVLALLTLVPGPDMAVVTRRALLGGRSDGLRTALGVAAGLLVWGALAVAGLTALLAASPRVYLAVKLLGVAYLLLLGVRALRSRDRHELPPASAPARGPFATGLATNLLNPKIAVFYSALLPTLAPPALHGASALAPLVLVHVLLTVGWLGGYAWALTRARAVFERPRVRRTLDRVTGAVLVGFALRLATEHG
jgi:threonine/homoserine/homoserine lactone efflux protein